MIDRPSRSKVLVANGEQDRCTTAFRFLSAGLERCRNWERGEYDENGGIYHGSTQKGPRQKARDRFLALPGLRTDSTKQRGRPQGGLFVLGLHIWRGRFGKNKHRMVN